MSNTATPLTPIIASFAPGINSFSQVTPVLVTFDTIDSDLTVFTPALSTNHGAIVSMVYEEASAHTLTLKSGTTTYVTLERDTYEGFAKALGTSGFIIVGQKGEALKIRCGTAAIGTMLIYCCEFPGIAFTN